MGEELEQSARERVRRLEAAAFEILADEGFDKLTVKRLVEVSGMSQPVVYRVLDAGEHKIERLVLGLLTRQVTVKVPLPDTGDLFGDLHELALGIVNVYKMPGYRAVMESVVASAARLPDAVHALEDFFDIRNEQAAMAIVGRAVARGELPPDTDGMEAIGHLGSLVYYKMFLTRKDFGPATALRAAKAVHAGLLAGAYATEPGDVVRHQVQFPDSQGVMLRGWLYTPRLTEHPWPAVVMTHGLGATIDLYTDDYAELLAGAGFAVLLYDHRSFGLSDGEPRQEVDPGLQIEGYRNALDYLQALPYIDPERLGIWGTSLSGGHVLQVAALDTRVRAVWSQAPVVDGPESLRRLLTGEQLRQARTAWAADRLARHTHGAPPAMIPLISADPTVPAALPDRDSYEWYQHIPATRLQTWRNEVTLQSVAKIAEYAPGMFAERIAPTPLAMVIADTDDLTHTDLAHQTYDQAAHPKELHLLANTRHFDLYTPPLITDLAHKAATFFHHHLTPSRGAS